MKSQSEFSPLLYAIVGGVIVVALGIVGLVGWQIVREDVESADQRIVPKEELLSHTSKRPFEQVDQLKADDEKIDELALSFLDDGTLVKNEFGIQAGGVGKNSMQSPSAGALQPTDKRAPLNAEEIFDSASPAVFRIVVLNESGDEIGGGSGFIITVDDAIFSGAPTLTAGTRKVHKAIAVTNFHVLENAVDVRLDFPEGIRGVALHIWNEDEKADVSLLQLALSVPTKPPSLSLNDGNVRTGANVFAIGSPRGLVNSLSTGIISGVREGPNRARILQTTASISPGSSGGPLLDENGEVVGITTASQIDGQQLNFAVTASEIKRLLELPPTNLELWRGKSFQKEEEFEHSLVGIELFLLNEQETATSPTTIQSLQLLDTALNALTSGKYDAAESAAAQCVEGLPAEFQFLGNYALGESIFAAAQSRNFQSLRNAIDSGHGDSATVGIQIKRAFASESSRAIPWLLTSQKLRADFAPTLQSLCDAHRHSGQKTDALIYAQDLVRAVPRCAIAYAVRGDVRSDLGEYDAAVKDYFSALELDPNCSGAPLGLRNEYRRAAAIKGISETDRRRLTSKADELDERLGEIARRALR